MAGILAGPVACGGSDDAAPSAGSTVADSAGIRIVTSNGPRWTLETAWKLSDAPVLTIGVVDGAPREQLFRVADAALLSDGRIGVANSGTSELRIFDRAGETIAAFDRLRVSAEGELWVRAFPLPGDESHVWSVFSAEGE